MLTGSYPGRAVGPLLLAAALWAASLLVGSPAAAADTYRVEVLVQVQRQDKPVESYVLEVFYQGDNGLFRPLRSKHKVLKPGGGYLLTRDAGRTWYALAPREGKCSRWQTQDLAAVLGGFISKLKDWANLKLATPQVSKLLEEPGEKILGLATTHYRFRTSFALEASFLFQSWKYEVRRLVDVWSTKAIPPATLRDWLIKPALVTGHEQFDRLINQRLAKVEGVILKEKVAETITDKDGKASKTVFSQEVTQAQQAPAPEIFRPQAKLPPCRQVSKQELEKHIKALLEE